MRFPKFCSEIADFFIKKNKKKKPIYSGEDFKFVSEMQSIIGYEIKNIRCFMRLFSEIYLQKKLPKNLREIRIFG